MKPHVNSENRSFEAIGGGPAAAGVTQSLYGFELLDRSTLSDTITRQIEVLLISGGVAPGETLPFRQLSEAFGVSIMPVRDAVSRLASDGALEVLPGKAARVQVLSLKDFRELTRLRLLLECFAAGEAAEHATEEDLANVAAHEAAFRSAASQIPVNSAEAVAANYALHFAVYKAAEMPMLLGVIERLWLKAGPILNFDMRNDPRRLSEGQAVNFHAALVDALRRRDVKGTRAALEADITAAARHVERTGRLPEK